MSAEAINGPTIGGGILSARLNKNNNSNTFSSTVNTNSSGAGSSFTKSISRFIKSLVYPSSNNVFSGTLPEFNWDKAEKAVGEELLHRGQPERFNFKFERQYPGMGMEGGCGGGAGIVREEDAAVLARL